MTPREAFSETVESYLENVFRWYGHWQYEHGDKIIDGCTLKTTLGLVFVADKSDDSLGRIHVRSVEDGNLIRIYSVPLGSDVALARMLAKEVLQEIARLSPQAVNVKDSYLYRAITIHSSTGDVFCDCSGFPLEYTTEAAKEEFKDVVMFDVEESVRFWAHPGDDGDEFDVLDVGMYTRRKYEHPCLDWRELTVENHLLDKPEDKRLLTLREDLKSLRENLGKVSPCSRLARAVI